MRIAPHIKGKLTQLVRDRGLYGPSLSDDGSTIAYSRPEGLDELECGIFLDRDGHRTRISGAAAEQVALSEDGLTAAFMEHREGGYKAITRWESGKSQVLDVTRGFERPVELSDDGELVLWEDYVHDEHDFRSQVKCWSRGQMKIYPGSQTPLLATGSKEFWMEDLQTGAWTHVGKDYTPEPAHLPQGLYGHRALDDGGQHMLYLEHRPNETTDLKLFDLAAGDSKTISDRRYHYELQPTISGDGKTMAFVMRKGEYNDVLESHIYLRREGRTYQVTQGDAYDGENLRPQLSEDGSVLAWRNSDRGLDKIYRLDLDWDAMQGSKSSA